MTIQLSLSVETDRWVGDACGRSSALICDLLVAGARAGVHEIRPDDRTRYGRAGGQPSRHPVIRTVILNRAAVIAITDVIGRFGCSRCEAARALLSAHRAHAEATAASWRQTHPVPQ
jgi:hypothetical protein